jgi:hypothetical protein
VAENRQGNKHDQRSSGLGTCNVAVLNGVLVHGLASMPMATNDLRLKKFPFSRKKLFVFLYFYSTLLYQAKHKKINVFLKSVSENFFIPE